MEQSAPPAPLFESRLTQLQKLHQGKVRDIYAIDADHLLIVTTDRLSAFDVILPDPIPGKGEVLTQISLFWFAATRHIIPNHLSELTLEDVVSDPQERGLLAGRTMIVRRLQALPVEAYRIQWGLRGGLGLVDEVLAVVDDVGVGRDDFVGDDAVIRRVKVEQLLRLRLARLDRQVDLPRAR